MEVTTTKSTEHPEVNVFTIVVVIVCRWQSIKINKHERC